MSSIITAIHAGAVPIIALDVPPECGAECIFAGRTRGETHPANGKLLRLEYEMYEPMALKLLRAMAEDAAKQWDCRALRVVHAKGPVAIGEASVVIQVVTPHRAASFEACRYLIERLKHELPVWKHEVWERGRTFVEGWCVNTA